MVQSQELSGSITVWLVVWNSHVCPSSLPAGVAVPTKRGQVSFHFAMALDLPLSFGECTAGDRVHVVAKLLVWDPHHDAHLFCTQHDSTNFLACGLLQGSGETYTLLNAEFRKQFPMPLLGLDDRTHVFRHDRPSWSSLYNVIDMCAGFGGMSQGMLTTGFQPVVAIDSNERFLNLYSMHCNADLVVGDVNCIDTLVKIWNVAGGAGTLVAGFACQPFSRLGDQRGGQDSRSLCLRGILACAYYLQVQAVILECVQPAAQNSFVQSEIRKFSDASGFHFSQTDLHLQEMWTARRSRAWWLLSSPFLGQIPINPWHGQQLASKVRDVIPLLQPWDVSDEKDLALNAIELEAFGSQDETFHRFLLNFAANAPCALHSWGAQVVECRCGCRPVGLSEHRLKEKGLFGCLVHSCQTCETPSVLRHLHPNEVMMLNGFDPVIDFGSNARLSLTAAGQMASPLQAAWIFSHLDARIQQVQGFDRGFQPEVKLQAFMTWLIMRGTMVWPGDRSSLSEKHASLVQYWDLVQNLSMNELVHPPRWPELTPGDINVASILDLIIRKNQIVPRGPCAAEDDVPMTSLDDEIAPTPWHDEGRCELGNLPTPVPDECLVIFHHEFANPIKLSVVEGVTIQHLVNAQSQLVGPLVATLACDHEGTILPMHHVLQLGQVVCIRCEDVHCRLAEPALTPRDSVGPASVGASDPSPVCVEENDPNCVAVQGVSPTLPWTFPVCDVSHEHGSFGPHDAGECPIPAAVLPDCDSWVSAAPLLGLQASQFCSLKPPVVLNTKHLWSLKHQLLQSSDRLAILSHQEGVWSDDEFRHHIAVLLQKTHGSTSGRYRILDPLLLTGWTNHGPHLCGQWAEEHPDVKADGVIILSACMIDAHWIPVVLTPTGSLLQFSTWDSPACSHDTLNRVIAILSNALGFEAVTNLRHHRLFFASNKCGALAMSYLYHVVNNSMLPTCKEEADTVHQWMREAYTQEIARCPLAHRPWVWGLGDDDDDSFPNEPGESSDANATLMPVGEGYPVGSVSHQCIDKDARMELLRAKGKMWGDDEIRFHIAHLLVHPRNVVNATYATIPGFLTLDPLLLTTWDSIGKVLCETWCKRSMDVPERGFHVVAVFFHNDHWFPVWIVPHGRTVVAHLIEDGIVDPQIVLPLMEVFQNQFSFHEIVLHTFPSLLPEHQLCGAAAISFLGHIMVGAPLPTDLTELSSLHANMKASFVQALHEGRCCICPVVWGYGNQSVIKLLAAELLKHGVPEDQVEQRAQQAVKAIGAESIHQALQSKNAWRSLKVLGNNVKFQFLLPAELAALAATNKGLPVGKRAKMPAPKTRPSSVEMVDPTKLCLPEGTFHAMGHPIPQIHVKQIGPLACGVALLTYEEAMPYLKAGTLVSSEPLAIAVFVPPGVAVETALPHTKIMLPCMCLVNNEPLLTEVVVVQLGSGFVEKQVASSVITLDQLEVVTVKVMVYRDEFTLSWDEFVSAPIKQLVQIFPILKRCMADSCQCESWHNHEKLPLKDPIMDVWRRQFLREGFKPTPASRAEIFSVCLRVPQAILLVLLSNSGASGAYTEPRTPDGKEVLSDFVVVWAPRMNSSELAHVKQTNPAVIGMARLGTRRGLRVRSDQAQPIHRILRPDAEYLPGGPKSQFVVGPFPWGVDRQAIAKALKQAGWLVRALQPNQPIPGRGSMWIIQSVDPPPRMIFHMAHGEVVVSTHKQPTTSSPMPVASVGSASTLTLCTAASNTGDSDPWLSCDPWGSYNQNKQPVTTTLTEGLQQLEERIQSAVLSKLPASMEQDDAPQRITTLESQVQQLITKHQSLEGQFQEFTCQNTNQFAVVQQQIQQQSQTFHGQLENQTQSVQAMFESQMQQIRNLLSKRPRDENPME